MSSRVLYLIDGSSYIFRAYFAIRNLSTSKGFPTNAVYGFSSMIFKFVKDFSPQYMGIVFDSKGKNFRNDIFPEYKANREEPPENLVAQFEKIYEIVDAFSFPLIMREGYEADDLIGTIAKKKEQEGMKVVIVTGDKDFCQLVNEHITLVDTMKNRKTDIQDVIEKYGVTPDRMTDVMALCGDKIDNIPGVKGIGEKTASKLIGEFGSLEQLYENLDKVSERQRKLLIEGEQNAFMSRELVKIRTDLDIDADCEMFSYNGFNRERLLEIFEELEFRNLSRDLVSADEGRSSELNSQDGKSSDTQYRVITSEKALDELVSDINKKKLVSVDIETTSQLPMSAQIVGIALTTRVHNGFYIPVAHREMSDKYTQLDIRTVLGKLKQLLESDDIEKIGQNLKYEYVVFRNNGIKLNGIRFDTILAAHFLDSSRISYRLEELARIYLSRSMTTYKEITGTGKSKIGFPEVDIETARDYACEDSDITMQLYEVLNRELAEEGLYDIYSSITIRLIEVLGEMEISGVKLDPDVISDLSDHFNRELEAISASIYTEVGYEFNLNSPLQLRKVLFDDLGLPVSKRTKTGEPSTDYEVLLDLSKVHVVPEMVLKHRGLSKLVSTYIETLPKLVNTRTKRVHTSYNPVGTTTGRLSSSEPNLQNIPIRSEEGRKIRSAFIPEEGFIFVSADYSQIDLRLLAHFSGDEKLVEAFRNNKDIHNRTAAEIFNIDEESVTPELRRLSKSINFGIIYGISPYGLARQLGISVSQAGDYIEKYFNRYSSVKSYLDSSVVKAQNNGYAETITGRRRPIPELNSSNRVQRGIGERAAINTPIQGSAADIINIAMINIHDKLRNFRSRMILQVHDELIFEVADDEEANIIIIVKDGMEAAYKLAVPLKVEINSGNNWAEIH